MSQKQEWSAVERAAVEQLFVDCKAASKPYEEAMEPLLRALTPLETQIKKFEETRDVGLQDLGLDIEMFGTCKICDARIFPGDKYYPGADHNCCEAHAPTFGDLRRMRAETPQMFEDSKEIDEFFDSHKDTPDDQKHLYTWSP